MAQARREWNQAIINAIRIFIIREITGHWVGTDRVCSAIGDVSRIDHFPGLLIDKPTYKGVQLACNKCLTLSDIRKDRGFFIVD